MPRYLDRSVDSYLHTWLEDRGRKPLILRGARQVGKSTTVRELGKRAPLLVELNLERIEDRDLVRGCRGPGELREALALRENLRNLPAETLLFLDEIQDYPEAISWLRYFHEDHPDLAVLCAGSLLEVRLGERGFSFPVGRVEFLNLHPFGFFEFLRASDQGVLADKIVAAASACEGLSRPAHRQALQALSDYALVGGMPGAIVRWLEKRSVPDVREVHANLWQALAEDIQKYRGGRDPGHLEAAFSSLKQHYGTRFKYENFAPGHNSGAMRVALGKLEGARLVTIVQPTSSVRLPFEVKARRAPKLLPLDVGVANFTMGVGSNDLRKTDLIQVIDGRVAEILVGHLLLAGGGHGIDDPLHFWLRESARANAEVDYLIPVDGAAIPVEVKAGATGSLRSIHQFVIRADHDLAVRMHTGDFEVESLGIKLRGETRSYRLLNAPLYFAEALPTLVRGVRDQAPS